MPLLKVFKKELNKAVDKQLDVSFDVKTDAFYLVKVAARARAWWQRLPPISKDFWADEELRVALDDSQLETKFNGNGLWGGRQIILLIQHLSSGIHKLTFLNKHKPFLETVTVYKIETFSNIDTLALTESRPEDTFLSAFISKSRPWITFYSQRPKILNISLEASAKDGKQLLILATDDADLQLKINGNRQANDEPKSHKYWYWCGQTLKGKSKTFEKSFAKDDNINLLELVSDRSPTVSKFLLSLQRIPTPGDPQWTGDFADDTSEMLLARLIFGEAADQSKEAKIWIAGSVLNRVSAKAWPDRIHEVVLQPNQYDPFKIADPNYPKIINPLKKGVDELTTNAWRESYEVSKDMLSGKTKNPTEATHFHGRGVTKEQFLDKIVPNGNFIRQIGDTLFYWSPN